MLIAFFAVSTTGCGERVPPGFYGMKMQTDGFVGDVLEPGFYSIWGRDKLVLIEAKEEFRTESLNILCADDLNLAFDLKNKGRFRKGNASAFRDALNRQGANIEWNGDVGVLPYEVFYKNYVRDPAVNQTRKIVSQFQTTQVRENREQIDAEIQAAIIKTAEGTPVEMVSAFMSNIDYPEMIERAMERKKEKEVAIGEEESKQAIEMMKIENEILRARKMKELRAAEAEAESVYMIVLGKAANTNYLKLRALENQKLLYENGGVQWGVAPSDMNVSPLVGSLK